jgi:hypothetical protein
MTTEVENNSQTRMTILAVDNGYILFPEPMDHGYVREPRWVAKNLDELAQLVRRLMVEQPRIGGRS